ncbi:MAG: HutP family protein [Clostridia bacterium]|nr:HutP family protein [Clostridia bacterium]
MAEIGSKQVCKAAIEIALTETRDTENDKKNENMAMGIKSVAIDFGSDFFTVVPKILERAVVAAKREGVINATHAEEGAVAGAAHEALQQIVDKCVGLNLGGKIGIARCGAHISVCVFFAIGLLNLNDIAIGMGHRVV